MIDLVKSLISKLPRPVDEWARLIYDFVPPSVRYGKAYVAALTLLRESETWGPSEFAEYQRRLLSKLIHHCAENVPYYRELFREHGIRPDDVKTADDLERIPFLTKEIVRKRKEDLLAVNIPARRRLTVRTSGSTGTPLEFAIDRATRAMERALAVRHLKWLGWKKGDVVAEIRAATFSDSGRTYRYFPASRQVVFDFTALDDEKLQRVVETLHAFRPKYIRALPWSVFLLARWMERNNKAAPPVRYVITASENLRPAMKEHVERVFKVPVIDHYGQNEQVAYAFQCAYGIGYHVQREMSIVELIRTSDGNSEIVGTCLHNYAMPFLRYRTGDFALSRDELCPCGRTGPTLASINGREVDVIVTPEGRLIAPGPLDFAFYRLPEIKEAQIIQEDVSGILVKVAAWDRLSEQTRAALARDLAALLKSDRLEVRIEEVEEISRTPGGKKLFLVSHLKLDHYSMGL
ncbi:MAG: phenylacetate--CoA ligase family protein [Desulfomonile sp.]|nr:phenylacetate--CoA ligase family protein [Desulfomonile sp.]